MTDDGREPVADALARLYDLDLAEDRGDVDLYLALARRTGGPILELAVGSGRVAVELAAEGHDVVGVDLDAAMLSRARARATAAGDDVRARLQLVEGDLLRAAEDEAVRAAGPYRLAILALNSILLLGTADGQRAAVAVMGRLLAPGGIAVIDAWLPTPADLAAFDGRISLEWLRTDPGTGLDVTKTAAAWFDSTRRIVTLTTVFDEGTPGSPPTRWTRQDALRLVTVDELVAATRAAGLDVETLAGGHDLADLDAGSERVVLVARKPEG